MNSDCLIEHHPMPHDHPEHPEKPLRKEGLKRLTYAFMISASVMALELFGGWISGSLALMADATHMMADSLALGMSILAAWLAERPKSKSRSFGYYRIEVLAAFLNGILLLGIAGFLISEAIDRWTSPHEVDVPWMLGLGLIGLLANLAMIFLMHHSHDANINLKAAFFHVIGDALSSCAVVAGGAIMLLTGSLWPDLIASLIVACMIIIMSVRLIYVSGHVLLEGTPRHMNPDTIEKELFERFPQIKSIHDLHIWEITSHLFAMTAHLEAEVKTHDDTRILIDKLNGYMRTKYGVGHTTFQVEPLGSHVPS